jgi:hypothetical protein
MEFEGRTGSKTEKNKEPNTTNSFFLLFYRVFIPKLSHPKSLSAIIVGTGATFSNSCFIFYHLSYFLID